MDITKRRGGGLSTETQAFLVFFVALAARVLAVLLFPDVTIAHQMVIFGGPIADAAHWHQVASEIALGEGIHTSLRPLYSLLLALPQQFFGNDLVVAKLANAALDSGSILFGYLIFRHLLAGPAALMIALSLAVLPNYIMFSHSLLTEHAGAFFLLAALVPMMSRNWSPRWWALAGLLTGLSNLARPLTLLAVPALMAVGFHYRGLRFVRSLAAFAIVLCLTLAPWVLVQYERHGIFSLSSNTNQVLAAATNPKYQQWSSAVQGDKLAEGVSPGLTIKEWDRIFRHDIVHNLKEWPLFWPTNIAINLWESLNDGGLWLQQSRAAIAVLALLWTLCGAFSAYFLAPPPCGAIRRSLLLSAAALGIAVVTGTWALLLVSGAVFASLHSRRCAILVSTYLVGSMFGHAFFGFSSTLDRLGLMYAPLVVGLQAVAFVSLGYGLVAEARLWWNSVDGWLSIGKRQRAAQLAWPARTVLATAGILLIVASGRLTATYLWQPSHPVSAYAATGSDPLAAMQKVRDDLAESVTGVGPNRLVVSDFIFPLNSVHVPDSLASQLGSHDPVYIFSIGFNGVGQRWTIVSGHDVPAMVGKRFVAVLADGSDRDTPIPDLIYLRPFSRILALAPLSRQGVDMQELKVTRWDCVGADGINCPARTTENIVPEGRISPR